MTLEVDSRHLLATSAVMFLLPLLLLVAGVIAGNRLLGALGVRVSADLGMILSGAAGFLVGLVAAILISRGGAKRGWLMPRIVEVADPAS